MPRGPIKTSAQRNASAAYVTEYFSFSGVWLHVRGARRCVLDAMLEADARHAGLRAQPAGRTCAPAHGMPPDVLAGAARTRWTSGGIVRASAGRAEIRGGGRSFRGGTMNLSPNTLLHSPVLPSRTRRVSPHTQHSPTSLSPTPLARSATAEIRRKSAPPAARTLARGCGRPRAIQRGGREARGARASSVVAGIVGTILEASRGRINMTRGCDRGTYTGHPGEERRDTGGIVISKKTTYPSAARAFLGMRRRRQATSPGAPLDSGVRSSRSHPARSPAVHDTALLRPPSSPLRGYAPDPGRDRDDSAEAARAAVAGQWVQDCAASARGTAVARAVLREAVGSPAALSPGIPHRVPSDTRACKSGSASATAPRLDWRAHAE
ncbi:hypothetical protein B0H10DRAFT_2211448 [Mycena sp. CBHHK59/15]|nr:hypothetical protein B0H10DRAFT_2211448 [Mycena sp. CBHHK59/15]